MNKTETTLHLSRYLVMVPVWTLVITAGFIFVWTLTRFTFLLDLGSLSEQELIIGLISIIDFFLVGVLTLMMATSLYALYVDETPDDQERKLPAGLIASSLDELKAKLGKVIFLIILVTFFKEISQYDFTSMSELLMLAGSILLIALALYFTRDNL